MKNGRAVFFSIAAAIIVVSAVGFVIAVEDVSDNRRSAALALMIGTLVFEVLWGFFLLIWLALFPAPGPDIARRWALGHAVGLVLSCALVVVAVVLDVIEGSLFAIPLLCSIVGAALILVWVIRLRGRRAITVRLSDG